MNILKLKEIINAGKFQVMPSLTDNERAELKESLATKGMQVPIVLDKDGAVIDGHNRYELAIELAEEGIDIGDIPVQISDLTDDTTKRKLAYELNLKRRHLSMRDKKKAAEKMLVEFPEMSNNAIAKTVSINDKTVNTIRKELENDGKIEEVTKRVGADGRKTQATSSEIPKSEPIVEEEIDNEQVEEDNGNYLKVGIMQGNTIRTTKVLEGFKARSKKVVPVGMIDTITNIVNSANLPPNAEGWDMVKKIVEEHVEFFKEVMDNRNAGKQPEPKEEENDLPFVEEETMEDNGATVNSNMEATPLDSKPVSSRVEKIKEKLDEINKEQAEKVDTYIQEEINKVAGALKSPVFSKWLSKSVKARLKEIHPDISKESVEAVEFVNAWNVIKQFIER